MNVVLQSRRTQSSRPFPSGPRPLYQVDAECEAADMKTTFHSHAHKTHFHMKKVLHLGSFLKWEFLELGNGLFNKSSSIINTVQIRHRGWLIHGSFAKVWNATFEPNSSFCSAHAISSQLCTILVISRPRIPTRNRKRWLYARTCKRFIIELW